MSYFDPYRGNVDPGACARLVGPNHGFFGPWLEMPGQVAAAVQDSGVQHHVLENSRQWNAQDPHNQYEYGGYRLQLELEMEKARKEQAAKERVNETGHNSNQPP